MKDESIKKVEDLIARIKNLDINPYDKLELMINLYLFLEDYEENIKILKKVKNGI